MQHEADSSTQIMRLWRLLKIISLFTLAKNMRFLRIYVGIYVVRRIAVNLLEPIQRKVGGKLRFGQRFSAEQSARLNASAF